MRGKNIHLNGTYYLNNSGSRWANYINGVKDQVKVLFPDGHIETRTALYYESFGNFNSTSVKIKGKIATYLQDSVTLPDGTEFKGIILNALKP